MKVICTLENAADRISGVKFTALEGGGKISEEISAEKAEAFASIPGYELVDAPVPQQKPVAPTKASKKAEAKAETKAAAPTPVPAPAPAPAPAAVTEDDDDYGDDDTVVF